MSKVSDAREEVRYEQLVIELTEEELAFFRELYQWATVGKELSEPTLSGDQKFMADY
jgi:hypothetical protein